MLKAYAIGFIGAVSAMLLAAVIWFGMLWLEKDGLVWGGTVYASKQEFNGYLKSNGLSYKTWLARNPGVAPWEPATRGAFTPPVAKNSRSAAPATTTPQGGADWEKRLLLVAIGLLLAVCCALQLRMRKLLPLKPAAAMGSLASFGRPGVPQTGGSSARSATRHLAASINPGAKRYIAGARADARKLHYLMRDRNIGVGEVAFRVLAFVTAGMIGVLVVLLLSG